jgi:hypothetical protein
MIKTVIFRIVLILQASLTMLVVSSTSEAQLFSQKRDFGLGIILGNPTSITAKYNMNSIRAFDGGLAYSSEKWTLLYSDILHHFPGAFGRRDPFISRLTPYLGLGAVLVISSRPQSERWRDDYFSKSDSSDLALGMRIPLGIEWKPDSTPIGIFLEIVPGLTLIPGTYSFLQGGLGGRFYF